MANYPTFSYYSRYFSGAFEGDVTKFDSFTPIDAKKLYAFLIPIFTKYLK